MKLYDAHASKFQDRLVIKKQRRRRAIYYFLGLCILAGLAAAFYFVFFSGKFTVISVEVNGLSSHHEPVFVEAVEKYLARKIMSVRYGRNIFVIRAENLERKLMAQFPFIQEIQIQTETNRLKLAVIEKTPEGIWCFGPDLCYYYDSEGKILEQTVASSGYLLTSVYDERPSRSGAFLIDSDYRKATVQIKSFFSSINLRPIRFTIPNDRFGELNVQTADNYNIIFSLDTPLASQLETLRIFLTEKRKDPHFNPRSIDLRVEGRVYYR